MTTLALDPRIPTRGLLHDVVGAIRNEIHRKFGEFTPSEATPLAMRGVPMEHLGGCPAALATLHVASRMSNKGIPRSNSRGRALATPCGGHGVIFKGRYLIVADARAPRCLVARARA